MKKIILVLVLLIFIVGCVKQEIIKEEPASEPQMEETQSIVKEQPEEKPEEVPKEEIKEVPKSYHIENVPLYQQNDFCYGASAMMLARYWGLSEEETQKLKQLIISGEGLMGPRGAPPIIIPALSKFNLGSFVYFGYLKGSDLNPLKMWSHGLDDPDKRVKTFNSPDEALLNLKRLVANKTPVIVITEWDLTKEEGGGEEGSKNDHFTVVVGYDENNIYTNDPSPDRGREVYSYPIDDFLKRWDLRGTTSSQAAFLGDYGMIWLEK